MSLATRCPVCQTVFRVVQDQLKVSEGWVRCGRCAKVFNAFEGLFDLEREFPALRSPTPSQRVLEDLATRNRNPKPQSQWPEDFDTAAATREVAPPTVPPSRPATTTTTLPAARGASPIPPAPASPPRTAATPSTAAPPTQPPPASAQPVPAVPTSSATPTTVVAFKDSAPFGARVTRPPAESPRDDGATIPPRSVVGVSPAKSPPAAERPAFTSSAPAVQAQPAPPQPPTVVGTARAAAPDIAIRDEPAPVPGTEEPEPAVQDETFDALFRSDGELAQPGTAADLDINLDSDVEPASLDDAVDSRLLTFVQEADRAERWRRPWVRVSLALAVLALVLLLAVQLLVAQRDLAVVQWPGTRALVQALCAPLNCRIEPLRRIDQLGVDSSGLTRLDDGPVYRLALVLHNRGETPLLMPSIDLSLTDATGTLVTRRMLSATDLGSARTTIAAGQEVPLQALLMSADRPLTGYTIEIFYP
ncbi:MAG TPA: DUF3426 domain-containing protein [Burkholderiaceae bacterium]|nr:DUF3426 domain-containing protein [Burkholderiaceae bacterium]